MTYNDVISMANNQSLRSRIAACAASEGVVSPEGWAAQNVWRIAASPGWDQLWEYHRINSTVNHNPDQGARNDVITDAAILTAVQAAIQAQAE